MSETATPHPSPIPSAAPRGGGVGMAALLVALLLVLGGLVLQIAGVALPFIVHSLGLSHSALGLFFGVSSIVTILVAIVAVILGAVGIQPQQPRGRLAAAAGLAVGATHLLSAIVGLVAPFVVDLLG